ncbi:hypothetical protein K2173_001897 [Erythroxylum novogranatense]|uniref:Homeobox-leucine zipper protein n=1 Tax=Erythroxylum novogranatense TaxID=1862640 RepID=A0AAV8SPW5_9ROSI|nr:hypothetical protein K2173_001897 [Erythroxylum novogranatense]
MDWFGDLRSLVSRPESSLNLLYNNSLDHYPGMDIKHTDMPETPNGLVSGMEKMSYESQEKKKKLTSYQLDSLERSFQEEIKLDPDRKMKLSRELGLQPRQIAVWFQNRRARWKSKQLERLYDALKQEYDVVSKEKQKLQEEVMKLKSMISEQSTRNKQVAKVYPNISGEEIVESTSVAMRSSAKVRGSAIHYHQIPDGSNFLNVEEHNPMPSSYWAVLPSYP